MTGRPPELEARSRSGSFAFRSAAPSEREDGHDRRLELVDAGTGQVLWTRDVAPWEPAPTAAWVSDGGLAAVSAATRRAATLTLFGPKGQVAVALEIRESAGERSGAGAGEESTLWLPRADACWAGCSFGCFVDDGPSIFALRLGGGERLFLDAARGSWAIYEALASTPEPLRARLRPAEVGFAARQLGAVGAAPLRGAADALDYGLTLAALGIAVEYGVGAAVPSMRALERLEAARGSVTAGVHRALRWRPMSYRRAARAALMALGEAPGEGPIAWLSDASDGPPIPLGRRPHGLAALRASVAIGMPVDALVATVGIPDDYLARWRGDEARAREVWRYDACAPDDSWVLEIGWSALDAGGGAARVESIEARASDPRARGWERLVRLARL